MSDMSPVQIYLGASRRWVANRSLLDDLLKAGWRRTDATYEHLIEIGAGALREHWLKRNSDQPSILYEPEARDIIAAIAEHVTMFPRDLLSEMTNRKKGPAFSEEAFDTFLAMAETFDVSRPAPVKADGGGDVSF